MTATETDYERRERIGATVRAMGPTKRVWEALTHYARWLWLWVTGRARFELWRTYTDYPGKTWRHYGVRFFRTDEPDCHCCAIGRPDLCIPRTRKNRKDPQ